MKKLFITVLSLAMICTAHASDTDKTLVSWVKLNDKSVTGGSVLTIQNGDQFDGILFTKEGQWIAGSENDLRTQKNLSKSTEVNSAANQFVQLAVVYDDNKIRIYVDHELYSEYATENVDFLSGQNNYAVFGISHFGGEGFISAEIDDARIYHSALTLDELKSLKPNETSEIKPYAWWDFEGDEIEEKTGRFVFHNLGEGEDFELEAGKLILSRWGSIIAVGEYIPETPQWPEDPPDNWVTYHLAHPGPGRAEPGDPNPAYDYNGRYHLHYIYNNYFGFSYAHVSSKDMVHWKWHPTVLVPPNTGHGMFSGTGFFTKEGRPAMIYHGAGSGRNQLSFALDGQLDEWTKPEPVEPKNEEGELPDIDHWDPDCWQYNDTYYALSGGEDPELMKSENLRDWQYLGKVLHEDYPNDLGVSREEDISCANMFKTGGKWMLLCISHALGCRYFLGGFKDEKYLPDFHALMNWVPTHWEEGHEGLVYFAPESMLTEDERRVMWAWMMGDISPTGVQSLPREIELPEDGILRMKPLKELEALRYDEIKKSNIKVKSDDVFNLDEVTGDAVELVVTFTGPLPEKFGLDLLGNENNIDKMTITFGAGEKTLGVGSINLPFKLREDEDLALRIFIDKNLVEVFANDRQAAAVAHEYIRENPNINIYTKDKDLLVKELKAWKMKSIYEGETVY